MLIKATAPDFGRGLLCKVSWVEKLLVASDRSSLRRLDGRSSSFRGRDLDRFHRCAGNGHLNLLNRADLYHCFLGLLQHEFFINSANLGRFLKRLLAANAIFFGCGLRNIVLEVANARCVIIINAQRMFVAHQVNFLALRVNLMLAVLLVPLSDGRILVHVPR